MRQEYAWRSLIVAALLGVMAFLVPARIVRIQTSAQAAAFRAQAERYAEELRTYYPERGEIYDRTGHLLAGNMTVYEIGVDLNMKPDLHAIALTLSVNLGEDYNEIYQTLLNPLDGATYVVVADYVAAEKVEALMDLKKRMAQQATASESDVPSLAGLEFQPHYQRSYPEGTLASNVLGFATRSGVGYFGVEGKYNDLLAGAPVKVRVPTDPYRAIEIPRVPNGTTLILTIHRDLQAEVETLLDQALYTYGAKDGAIVVMDPRNGEILAMATTPRMELNEFWNYEYIYDSGSEYNRAISQPYEPGSVFKILTMAAALDSGLVRPDTTYLDTGSILVGGTYIKNWDEQAWGPQSMIGCLQHSLNVCLAWVATELGAQTFYGYMNRFGIGHPTGVDLEGEAAGRLKIPGDGDWYPIDLGTNSFGQGVTVTPVQMLMAASAIANQGRMVTPHVLYAMQRDGRQYNVPPQQAGYPISPETARLLSEMLAISLETESSNALLPGYRVAGKTGTAQIPTEFGWYDFNQTNASFIGWGPVDDPRFMIYIWLERPSTSIWGSETAAPLFAQVAEKTVILLGIPPDDVRRQMAGQ